jgi:glutathione synthase/RimK-type ligase-like ATP-grasp enzyme
MKVAILHHDLEYAERKIYELFKKGNHEAFLIDIRNANIDDFGDVDLVLNRVYASVANRDYPSIKKTLELLKELEDRGVFCLNSYRTSFFDYDKYASFLSMKEKDIPTPKTIFINQDSINLDAACKKLMKELSFPMIIKRNIGGRGKDISRVGDINELLKDLENKFNNAIKENYFGGFVAQEFIKSNRDHDCRLGVIDGEVAFSSRRSLISYGTKDPWLASTTNGSVEGIYEAESEEKEIGLLASDSIGSRFNELDIMFSEEGPIIIENNPTPNYFDCAEDIERIEAFVSKVEKSLLV